jgi:hypothetical protein
MQKKTAASAVRRGGGDPRGRIQVVKLIQQLEAHALGKLELRPTQVSAALGLLKKALPDLGNVSLRGEGKKPVRLVVAWKTAKS